MAKPITSWQSEDGLLWSTEYECVTHECLKALFAAVPGLKDREAVVRANVDALTTALAPLAAMLEGKAVPAETENHPPVAPENHPDYSPRAVERVVYPAGVAAVPFTPPTEAEPELPPTLQNDFWQAQRTRAGLDDDKTCDCGALLAGNAGSPHLKSCAVNG